MLNPKPLWSFTSSTILTSGDHSANSPSSSSSVLTSTLWSACNTKEHICFKTLSFQYWKEHVRNLIAAFQTGVLFGMHSFLFLICLKGHAQRHIYSNIQIFMKIQALKYVDCSYRVFFFNVKYPFHLKY